MNMKCNRGFMGGKEQSALYIIGYDKENTYYYLDPHFVKNSVSMDELEDEELTKDYFEKVIFTIQYNKLSNSVCIPMYLKGKEDFVEFWQGL